MRRVRAASVVLASLLALAAPASAFDAGPHSDMTRDALTSEGFGPAAADVGVVQNWFVDYYWNAKENPFSGHAAWYLETLANAKVFTIEHWDPKIVKGTNRMHFDSSVGPDLSTPQGIDREWQRMLKITRDLLADARRFRSPLMVLAIVGTSLHTVQDFYAHTNWVETAGEFSSPDGPGWTRAGMGTAPTWFDIPRTVRESKRIYSAVHGVERGHGKWLTDTNASLAGGLNKDWPGRPLYESAYLSAYFASRQWIGALRTMLGDDALWARAQRLAAPARLRDDLTASLDISKYAGHWQGNGEPCAYAIAFCGDLVGWAGSVLGVRAAIKRYHEEVRKSPSREMFERVAPRYAADPEAPDLPEPASSRDRQAQARFVKLEVLNMNGYAFELGDPGPDDADIYASARIRGQSFASPVIHDHDRFSFPPPYAPFTWMRSVPVTWRASPPVEALTVRVETGNKRGAGTDDDVYLRVNDRLRFSLEKRAYDDFERDDDDTYAVALDGPTRSGLTVGDIGRLQIEKSRDGVGGAWFLKGVTVRLNGRVISANRTINRWLEDDRRVVRLSSAVDHRTTDVVPVWLRLDEDDYLYGADDDGDINEYDRTTARSVGYVPGAPLTRWATGGARLSGRLSLDNGDKARARYRLTTIPITPPPPVRPVVVAPPPEPAPPTTAPPSPAPTPPAPPEPPDLVITSFDMLEITVKNQGTGAAGPFDITATGYPPIRSPGLAAGASATYQSGIAGCAAGEYHAFVDSSGEVPESDETNNTRDAHQIC